MYLGFDLSTQQLKAVITNEEGVVVMECHVSFDEDLPNYQTTSGVHIEGDKVTAPVVMWVQAMDLLLRRLQDSFDLSRILCIGGCGQQHGSVYWNDPDVLPNLDPKQSLYDNLKDAFAVYESPIWMDSSTTSYCQSLEKRLGGSFHVAELTGSKAYERFTGNQIAKISYEFPALFNASVRISLVSSFVASILIGDFAPIDYSDGSGMNLMNIKTNTWSQKCLDACSPDGEELFRKLGGEKGLVPSGTSLGNISKYFCARFGFSSDCQVSAFTGDNPASFVGMGVLEEDMVLSLGSSDTLLMWLNKANFQTLTEGHILANPIDPRTYLMGMLCFKNGSLVRDRIAEEVSGGDWETFNILLDNTMPGNGGHVGIYYDYPEILPARQGRYRFCINADGSFEEVKNFDDAEEARAVIEGQVMCKKIYAEKLGFRTSRNSRILVTGGASKNVQICQIIADIFARPVFALSVANSAALGGALLARRCLRGSLNHTQQTKLVALPKDTLPYDRILPTFRACLLARSVL